MGHRNHGASASSQVSSEVLAAQRWPRHCDRLIAAVSGRHVHDMPAHDVAFGRWARGWCVNGGGGLDVARVSAEGAMDVSSLINSSANERRDAVARENLA